MLFEKNEKLRVKIYPECCTPPTRSRSRAVNWDEETDYDDVTDEASRRSDVPRRSDSVEAVYLPSPQSKKDRRAIERDEYAPRVIPVMKPVPDKKRDKLYRGISYYGEGRHKYLHDRYTEKPEDKFYFPLCSSWEYGWTWGTPHENRAPEYGHRNVILNSIYRPNDTQLRPRDHGFY